ncbi:molybdopterin-dependent oxidoreductase [Motiliproteus sp. SC1-56]|uniref:molybdopterin-dependent oxidoreductase n=1 Tax=Motiliproteus sp. SC1-56 TaxID=2799565 RepID=UPI001A9093D1|nr:molybdopterin-dependent oxidoreductase [Motiliproteus sp. SC1-56]
MRSVLHFLAFLSTLVVSIEAIADLPSPSEPVLLTISGNIANTNDEGAAHFDRPMLDALPQHQFATTTPWTKEVSRYEGVLLSDLLEYVKASGQHMTAVALNDYRVKIDLSELTGYPIILAMRKDGKPMRVRDKGPLWILYPMSDYPELDRANHHASMVWQLRSLHIE